MPKTFDFNSLEQPTLHVVLRDEAKTELNLTLPEEKLIEKLLVVADEFKDLKKDEMTGKTIKDLFDFMALIFSHNEENIKITGTELKGKYKANLVSLIVFTTTYLEFINEVQNAKN